MITTRERVRRIESEVEFRGWVSAQRMFETMSIEELETLAGTGQWPKRPEPEPGTSRLDRWTGSACESSGKRSSRNSELVAGNELEFYAIEVAIPQVMSDRLKMPDALPGSWP